MIAKAVAKYVRISPKKARLVTRPLHGMTVDKAYSMLAGINKKSSFLIHKLLKAAFTNAQRKDPTLKEEHLFISRISADSGPVLNRFRAMSMGRAGKIRKRTSHLTLHLDIKKVPGLTKLEKPNKKRPIFKKDKDKTTKQKKETTVKDKHKKRELKK